MPRLIVLINYRVQAGPIVRGTLFLCDLPMEAGISPGEVVHISQSCLQLCLIDLSESSKFIIRPTKSVRLVELGIPVKLIVLWKFFIEKLALSHATRLVCPIVVHGDPH